MCISNGCGGGRGRDQSSLWTFLLSLLSKFSMGASSNEEAQATMPSANATKRESEYLTIFGLFGVCV